MNLTINPVLKNCDLCVVDKFYLSNQDRTCSFLINCREGPVSGLNDESTKIDRFSHESLPRKE